MIDTNSLLDLNEFEFYTGGLQRYGGAGLRSRQGDLPLLFLPFVNCYYLQKKKKKMHILVVQQFIISYKNLKLVPLPK